MRLELLFNSLANGELYLHSSCEGGVVKESAIKRLVQVTNDALLNLSTRFVMIENDVVIQTLDTVSIYDLKVEHAVTNPTPDVPKYIIDTEFSPFTGDLLKILGVYDELGCWLPLNDSEQCRSAFTPKYNQIQLPTNKSDQTFFIGYQARHPILEVFSDVEQTLNQEVNVPPVLEEALRTKIAHTLYSAMSGQDDTAKAITLENRYMFLCQDVEDRNLVSQNNISTNTKLRRRGFP